MIRRDIELDEEADVILSALADEHGGSRGEVISDLLRSRQSIEQIMDEWENEQAATLAAQRTRSDREFSEGRVVPWKDLKRRHDL